MKDITKEEVRWAIRESKRNKAPGMDGLSVEFYQKTVDDMAVKHQHYIC